MSIQTPTSVFTSVKSRAEWRRLFHVVVFIGYIVSEGALLLRMSGNRVENRFNERLGGSWPKCRRQIRHIEGICTDVQSRVFALLSPFSLVIVVHAIQVLRAWTSAVDIVFEDASYST